MFNIMFNMIWLIVFSIILIGMAIYIYCQNKYLKHIEKSNVYIDTLINNLPVGLYFRDLKGKILLANKEFSKIAGISYDQLQENNIYGLLSDEYIKSMVQEDLLVAKTKNSIAEQKEIAIAGNKHFYRVLKLPMLNQFNQVIGYAVFLDNIDKEREDSSRKESFVATLTHDLKTPTNAQLSSLNMLLNGFFGKLSDEQKQIISLTKESCQYMSDLIATILDTYNYESGQIGLNYEEFDIVALISELCANSNITSNSANQKIIFKKDCDKCVVNADKLQIKRVIVNLLSNAITYGYPEYPIYVVLENQNDSINLYVENKSKQIPESELKTIFDKFKKTKFSYFNKTGTGLGLYLAKYVIKMHKGEIYAKSFENGTCIFGFRIPKSMICESVQFPKNVVSK